MNSRRTLIASILLVTLSIVAVLWVNAGRTADATVPLKAVGYYMAPTASAVQPVAAEPVQVAPVVTETGQAQVVIPQGVITTTNSASAAEVDPCGTESMYKWIGGRVLPDGTMEVLLPENQGVLKLSPEGKVSGKEGVWKAFLGETVQRFHQYCATPRPPVTTSAGVTPKEPDWTTTASLPVLETVAVPGITPDQIIGGAGMYWKEDVGSTGTLNGTEGLRFRVKPDGGGSAIEVLVNNTGNQPGGVSTSCLLHSQFLRDIVTQAEVSAVCGARDFGYPAPANGAKSCEDIKAEIARSTSEYIWNGCVATSRLHGDVVEITDTEVTVRLNPSRDQISDDCLAASFRDDHGMLTACSQNILATAP